MKSTDIVVDVIGTIGPGPYLACSCEPVYKYDEANNRTDEIVAHKVEIALPQKKLAKIGIKVETTMNPLPELDDIVEVDFTNLSLGVYTDRLGHMQLYGKAGKVKLADNKTTIKMAPKGE